MKALKHIYRLRYNISKAFISFTEKTNIITGQTLSDLGISKHVNLLKEHFLSLIQIKENHWKIINKSSQPVFIKIPSIIEKDDIKLEKEGSFEIKNLLNAKIYFNKEDADWDYLYFDRTPVYEKSDKDLLLNFEDIKDLFEDVPKVSSKLQSESNNITTKEEKLDDYIFDGVDIDKLIKEYSMTEQTTQEPRVAYTPSIKSSKKSKTLERNEIKVLKNKIIEDEDEDEFFLNDDMVREIMGRYDSKQHISETKERLRKLDPGSFNENGKRLLEDLNAYSGYNNRRLKKCSNNKELTLPTNTTCAICLDSINKLANLDKCNHDFCLNCIKQWSKKTNKCPLCKKDFKIIFYYEKNTRREIKVKKRRLDIVEDDFYLDQSDDACMVCLNSDNTDLMLVCDRCQRRVCHTFCDGLDSVPQEEWYCRYCREHEVRRMIIREDFGHYSDGSFIVDSDIECEMIEEEISPEDLEAMFGQVDDNKKDDELNRIENRRKILESEYQAEKKDLSNRSKRIIEDDDEEIEDTKSNNIPPNISNNISVNVNLNVHLNKEDVGGYISHLLSVQNTAAVQNVHGDRRLRRLRHNERDTSQENVHRSHIRRNKNT